MRNNERILEFNCRYRFLSNFAVSPIIHNRIHYSTVEHAYQAAKTTDKQLRLHIASLQEPRHAKLFGRKLELRPDWDDIRIDIMRILIKKKFRIPTFRKLLIQTGNSLLVEGNTWNDTFWGVCKGEGSNHLGKLLMEERRRIKDE